MKPTESEEKKPSDASDSELAIQQRPALKFWRVNNPFIQNLLLGACLFCNPGLYLTITGLGAGGGKPSSVITADISNGVLYGVFACSATIVGGLINTLGPRILLFFGITGYPIYLGSMWYFDVTGLRWFPIFAGAYLGITAGCLWTTAAFVCNTYAEEKDKGVWRSIQWMMNALGATIGALVALIINLHATTLGVPHSVYITFIVIQCCSFIIPVFVVDPSKLVRPDGTPVAKFDSTPTLAALKNIFTLFKDWRIVIMLPTFFAPELFLVLQSSINSYAYTLRTRSLNNLLSYLFSIPCTFGMGYLLDSERIGGRRKRGLVALSLLTVWMMGTYIAQTIWLHSWNFKRNVPGPQIDWSDSSYPGAVIIYMLYGAPYGMFQNLIIWVFGSFTNQPKRLSVLAGLFVGVLNAGSAVSFGVDATAANYQVENAAWFAITAISFPILFFVISKCTHDTNYFEEAGVGVPKHVQEEMDKYVDGIVE